jgi:bifunctional non-homologous end joining protein LigD
VALPGFVAPMLATLVDEPFDSDEHLFEVKWDGIRALAFVEGSDYRLLSRNRLDLFRRYPELAGLANLPDGTLLDGELVVLEDGRPSFPRGLERVQATRPIKVEALARQWPAQYVVFDLLHDGGESVMKRPLVERRRRLEALLAEAGDPRLVFSEGLIGPGKAFFETIRERQIEGIVAKELDSAYLPGKRTRSWLKVKTTSTMPCVILGYVCDDGGALTSLVIAAEEDGKLVCVGRVGSGLSDRDRRSFQEEFDAAARPTPIVPVPDEIGAAARWIEPGAFCTVSYLERTKGGLRAPVFVERIAPPG